MQNYIYGFDHLSLLLKYKNNKSIKFFGIVSSNILYQAYSKAFVIVNPHLRLKNNGLYFSNSKTRDNLYFMEHCLYYQYIHFYGNTNFSIPEKCFYETKKELTF